MYPVTATNSWLKNSSFEEKIFPMDMNGLVIKQ